MFLYKYTRKKTNVNYRSDPDLVGRTIRATVALTSLFATPNGSRMPHRRGFRAYSLLPSNTVFTPFLHRGAGRWEGFRIL
jgi:hypothetical protein